jgi:hypothetical protein
VYTALEAYLFFHNSTSVSQWLVGLNFNKKKLTPINANSEMLVTSGSQSLNGILDMKKRHVF